MIHLSLPLFLDEHNHCQLEKLEKLCYGFYFNLFEKL